ncbi:MAG TPA: DUF2950 domain-containing protein, partial [Crenalkalicoccus sp.]|nr:DUF2950 domain-containing protein [Crenalkalicoccus sp.]
RRRREARTMSGTRRMALLGGLALALPAPGAPRAQTAAGEQVGPLAFPSPERGFAAMAQAAQRQDQQELLRILGGGARALIRSGDPTADRAALRRFAEAYAEKAEIQRPAPDRAELLVGRDAWPLPIPMVRRNGSWRFDAKQGALELVNRRIGRNELDTIEALHAIVDAQDEYARTAGRQGAFRAYARRFFSTPGTHDGLYWPTLDGQAESPLGALAAAASAGGYGLSRDPADAPRPFHGYLFRMLEAQGPHAPGGATDYVVDGRMIGGFGVIAWPAQYGVSGIQTFLVSHAGTVYQRNLGPETARLARGITAFDPGPGWERVAE